jgi:hypothetical protein
MYKDFLYMRAKAAMVDIQHEARSLTDSAIAKDVLKESLTATNAVQGDPVHPLTASP